MRSSTKKESCRYLSVAYLRRHEGHGWFLIELLTEEAERFKPGKKFFLAPPLLNLEKVTVGEVRKKSYRWYLRFLECEKLAKPETIVHRYLQIPLDEAKKLEPDEYWLHEIIGLSCFTRDGKYLGRITSVMKTKANDVFLVDEGKYLIPAVKEVVKEVKVGEGRVIIEELPGLLEL